MSNQEKDYYYAMGKKVKLHKLPDSFALRYKGGASPEAVGARLSGMADFADAEERKDMPQHRLVLITLPPSKRLTDIRASLESLEQEDQVEFVVPVYREPASGLRLIATDEITVRFKNGASQADIDQLNRENGAEVVEKNRFVPNQYILRIKNAQDTIAVANKYQESGLAEFASPNFVSEVHKYSRPNDVLIDFQWHLANTGQGSGLVGEDVDAQLAWDFTTGSPNIVIAIIDDGVDIDHPDLQANIWQNPNSSEPDVHGWDFFNNNNDPRPKKFSPPYSQLPGNDSHGTPCAGVAAAAGNNNQGVAGLAYHCQILPVKIFLGDDLVAMNTLADAIRYAGRKAHVLSNSWGIPPDDNVALAIKDVVQTGRNGKGCPVLVAAGNGGGTPISFPASVPEAIAVGASTNQGVRAGYSQYGAGLDFVAPSSGGTLGIFTTDVSIPGRGFNVGNINSGDAQGLYTNSFGGTSSATPLAAGAAALILSLNPDLTWDKVRQYLRDTADKIDPAAGNYVNGISDKYGFGRINAYKALKAVKDGNGNGGDVTSLLEKTVSPGLAIPDNLQAGLVSAITVDEDGAIASLSEISVNISHTYRGDLTVSLFSPDNTEIKLHDRQGGGADNLIAVYSPATTPALELLKGKGVKGQWLLKVADLWTKDFGTLNQWGMKILIHTSLIRGTVTPGLHIPDTDPAGITSAIKLAAPGKVKGITVTVDISHTYIQDLTVSLVSPSGKNALLHDKTGGGQDNIQQTYSLTTHPQLGHLVGEDIAGDWQLKVIDQARLDEGKLNQWGLEISV